MKRACLLALWAAALLLLTAAYFHAPALALWVETSLAFPLRGALASLSSRLSLSVTALAFSLLPVLFLLLLLLGLNAAEREGGLFSFLCRLSSLFLLTATLFLLTFAPAYHRPTVWEEWGLEAVSAEERAEALLFLRALSAEAAPESLEDEELARCSLALRQAAERLSSRYPLPSPPKAEEKLLRPGGIFSRLGIIGLYSFPFCEITLNGDYPADTLLFTLAHEQAHALGRMREEEADLLALALCLETEEPALMAAAARGILSRLPEGESLFSLVAAYLSKSSG